MGLSPRFKSTAGGALSFVRTASGAPKLRPLRSSFCSLHLPQAAVANEPSPAPRKNLTCDTSEVLSMKFIPAE
ncbi:MAG: hypothetical protein E7571_08245 [Ruminococcaceae bacterium]|nr:hypothetical protein [Oscillospiraceae bacterium]